MEYAPVCASVQIQCVTTPCNPVEETFGNRCMMEANSLATFLYNGECGDPQALALQQAYARIDTILETLFSAWTTKGISTEKQKAMLELLIAKVDQKLTDIQEFLQRARLTEEGMKKYTMQIAIWTYVKEKFQQQRNNIVNPPVACTKEYMPVCGQPPMPTCPDGYACAQVMPAPTTYGNDCMRKAAGAEFLYQGECK